MFELLRALHDDVVSKTFCQRSEEGGCRLGIIRIGHLPAVSVGPVKFHLMLDASHPVDA